jgi:hypothetical protein
VNILKVLEAFSILVGDIPGKLCASAAMNNIKIEQCSAQTKHVVGLLMFFSEEI